MAEVVLENVSRIYSGDRLAVDSLSLRAGDGEFLVLVGPSGCGKSTTLRMIAGLEEISSGEIRIGSQRVNELPPRSRNIAMVFQNYALYPHMTVRRNLSFGLELRYGGAWPAQLVRRIVSPRLAAELGAKRREIPSEVQRVAKTLAIDHLLDRLPRELSGGERQRVALGRAMVRQPAAFLFDEPLSNLDAKLRAETRRELKELHQRLATTMVYVTHDQIEALTLGDRIAVLDRGRLQQVGTPQEVYHRPANRFVAGFVGSPAMNFFTGMLNTAAGEVVFQGEGLRLRLPRAVWGGLRSESGRRVALGVRPEQVQLSAEGPLAGTAALVEPLGDSQLVHVRLSAADGATSLITSKIASATVVHAGDTLRVGFQSAGIHVFDAETGARLDGPATGVDVLQF